MTQQHRRPRWWARLALTIAARRIPVAELAQEALELRNKLAEADDERRRLADEAEKSRFDQGHALLQHRLQLAKAEATNESLTLQVELMAEIIERDRARVQSEQASYAAAAAIARGKEG